VLYRKIFDSPATTTEVFRFLDALLKGNLVPDAVHAAVAIESGCEWVTADTDFARFTPSLRWKHL
jgi:predicted nucleic acid-binding protein